LSGSLTDILICTWYIVNGLVGIKILINGINR
jgi:hypothetical protein